jgi:hypothetical protein
VGNLDKVSRHQVNIDEGLINDSAPLEDTNITTSLKTLSSC